MKIYFLSLFVKISKILFIALAFLFIFCFFFINATPIIKGTDYLEVYLNNSSSCCDIKKVSSFRASLIFNKYGEAYTFNANDFNLVDFLNYFKAEIKQVQKTQNGISYYAFSSKIKYKKKLGSDVVNLQIHVNDSSVKIGTPIIFGSF